MDPTDPAALHYRKQKQLKKQLKYSVRRRIGDDYVIAYRLPPKDSSIPKGHVAVSVWDDTETCTLIEEKELVDDESQLFARYRDIISIDDEQFSQLMKNLQELADDDKFGLESTEFKKAFDTLIGYLKDITVS